MEISTGASAEVSAALVTEKTGMLTVYIEVPIQSTIMTANCDLENQSYLGSYADPTSVLALSIHLNYTYRALSLNSVRVKI